MIIGFLHVSSGLATRHQEQLWDLPVYYSEVQTDTRPHPPSLPSLPLPGNVCKITYQLTWVSGGREERWVTCSIAVGLVTFSFYSRNEILPSVQGTENSVLLLEIICATALLLCYLAGKFGSRGKGIFALPETSSWRDFLQRRFSPNFLACCLLYVSTALLLGGQLGVERGPGSALPPLWTGLKQFLRFLEHSTCKSAHLLNRPYTRGWGRFWAVVKDSKNLDYHNEKFSLINVVERVETLGCNEEIRCVGYPSWEVCATLKWNLDSNTYVFRSLLWQKSSL